jgi:hypothetical protein
LARKQTERLDLRWGRLTLQQLAFDIPVGKTARSTRVSVNGEQVKHRFVMAENRVVLFLAEPATMEADQALEIDIEF